MEHVPTLDLGSPSKTERAALDAACRDHGFFLLRGHGEDDLIEATWRETRRFFESAAPTKEAVRRTEERPLGYYDRELTKRRRDCKEVFDFMSPRVPERDRTPWPTDLPGFGETLRDFFEVMGRLSERTVALVHETLGLPPDVAKAHVGNVDTSTVRLNRYPVEDPVPEAQRAGLAELGGVALGHHTDPGVLTLLLQDATGGLQTHSREHGWVDVPPEPGTIVVNLADTLQVWTNDRYRAAVHRVVPMTGRERYSIPFFYNPDRNAVVEPIEALCEGPPRYRRFTWREFIQARIDDNYTDLGTEDTQVAHFRIAPAA